MPAARVDGRLKSPQQALALQRYIGNAAVGRLLSRHADHDEDHGASSAVAAPVQAAPGATAAAKAPGHAAAEAIAAETVTRINKAIDVMAKTNGNPTVKNTAQLLRGPSPRVQFTPMTPRSDSEAIRTVRGQTAGTVVYFFTGTSQPAPGPDPKVPPAGTLERRPTVVGTVRGDSLIIIRGQSAGGAWRAEENIKGTLIHECSHILLKSYGEHPGTITDDASFDRYKDEFRAYFVEQFGSFAGEKDLDKRATKIRKHLIGSKLDDTQGYPKLRTAYWSRPAGDKFRTDIDNHKRPDGLNLTNSPRLDRFVTTLGPATTDPYEAVDEVIVAIAHMTAAERVEARASGMIKGKIEACGADAARRIFAALDAPTTSAFTHGLNPGRSPRIAKFYEEIARSDTEKMQAAYSALKADERAELQRNAAAMVYVDHNILEPRKRACVYAMLTSCSTLQYAAMEAFLDECFFTNIGIYGDAPTEIPAELRAAARGLTLPSRLALYRLVEDACRFYVDSLPPAVSKPLLLILRGDADP